MPKRFNRHIGREMEYPYEAPQPRRQVAYVFDTNKCIACQTCTVACKGCWTSGKGQEHVFWNNVESKPYGGYPMSWDGGLMEILGAAEWKDGVLASETIFEGHGPLEPPRGHRPGLDRYAAPNLGEDDITGQVDRGHYFAGVHPMWMFYLARICNHCDHPACLAACPRKAIYKRNEDGIVLVDQQRCRGYQECVRACPYKKVYHNAITRISEKCIGCFPRVEQGQVALCVESCIGKIRMHGSLTTNGEPRADNPLDYIVRIRRLALPLYPQFGTGPNVYYVPPIHVHPGFNEQLFGPGAADAVALYREVKDDPQLLGALLLFGASERMVDRFAVEGRTAIGWDGEGEEVARVPFTEPFVTREHWDPVHEVYRHNTT